MQKLGKKQLVLQLHEPLDAIPAALPGMRSSCRQTAAS